MRENAFDDSIPLAANAIGLVRIGSIVRPVETMRIGTDDSKVSPRDISTVEVGGGGGIQTSGYDESQLPAGLAGA